ncbi:MAG TPA: tyrosine-type recombinase/integrase [Acidimicrobiales bacterium]|jgi:integrase|nr:tyrosine-type recombinase/integrase [Acidimicrobiales bacterium]
MSTLRDHLEDYLALRRALGFKLERAGALLAQFVTFAEENGAHVLTAELALAWARIPVGARPIWVARRLEVVRRFSRHLAVIDPNNEVIPTDLFAVRATRRVPYLYSPEEIAALMEAAGHLPNPLKAATFETLVGLLACTGLRVGEAMRLDRCDFDAEHGLLTVRNSKFNKSRQVLLDATTVDALRRYGRLRDELCPSPQAPALLLSSTGARLGHPVLQPTFVGLLRQSGVGTSAPRRPRVHDLRHSFTVATLVRWYRDGGDVAPRMPALSTYLGHVDPSSTYWYLQAAPELLALAAERLESTFGGGR